MAIDIEMIGLGIIFLSPIYAFLWKMYIIIAEMKIRLLNCKYCVMATKDLKLVMTEDE